MAKMFCLNSSRSCILKSFNFPSFGFPVVKCKELSVFHSKWIHEVTSSVLLSKKLINDSKQKSEGLCTSTCSFLYHNENKLSNAASKISQASQDFPLESEEDELNRESPLVHYASRRVLFVLQDSFLKEVSIPCPKHETSLDNYVNEANLLKDSHRTFANFPEDKEEAVYLIEAGKRLKVVPDIGKLPVNFLPWRTQQIDLANLLKYYAGLAKSRLTGLVVLTAMAGYAVAPAAFDLNGFLFCLVGTALVSSSANSINQVFEVPYDSQMDRTKNRVLVRGLLTPLHAFIFGLTCAGLGISSLYFGVNGITATLGGLNLILYTSVYTPLKRVSIINTWVGAIVGAIPPIMGWTGCTGALDGGVWIMGGILYAWQFPHFNALSWNLRHDYSRAGYRMMTVTNPGLCRRTALRYSASLLLLSTAAPIFDVTTWTFAADSLPLNLYFTFLAWKFHKDGDSKSSRKLFRFSLFHLPALLALMIISKKPKPNAESDQTTS